MLKKYCHLVFDTIFGQYNLLQEQSEVLFFQQLLDTFLRGYIRIDLFH